MYTPIVVHKPILREGILENIYLCWRLLFNARYMTKINPPRVRHLAPPGYIILTNQSVLLLLTNQSVLLFLTNQPVLLLLKAVCLIRAEKEIRIW